MLQHCEEGFASKDGWVVVDDSLRPRFDLESNEDWVWMKKVGGACVCAGVHGARNVRCSRYICSFECKYVVVCSLESMYRATQMLLTFI